MRVPPRRIRSKLEAGECVFGATVQLPSPDLVEIAGYAGVDYVWIDAEHGTMDVRDVGDLVRAADASGIDALIRVPDHSPTFIQSVLDAGAAGIIAPHVRTAAEAAALVASAKYAPDGTRGSCPQTRAVGHLSTHWSTDWQRSNADVLVFGLIEDFEGVENVAAIAASGIDGLLFGSFDLSQSLGLDGAVDHPELEQMQRQVTAAVTAAGIQCINLGWDFDDFATVCSYSRIFNIASDRNGWFTMIRDALADKVAAIAKVNANPSV